MIRKFVFQDGNSHKFWTIQVSGSSFVTVYGRVGSAGSATTKEFDSPRKCEEAAAALVREKVTKGYVEVPGDESSDSAGLSEKDFWNLIDRSRKNSGNDPEEQASLLTEQLASRPVEDIVSFGRIYETLKSRSYTSDLWAAAYIVMGGCSDDGFDYFRDWLISRGQSTFENTLRDPEYLVRIVKVNETYLLQAESMDYVASSAYEEKTGQNDLLDLLEITGRRDLEMDWEETKESLEKKFPKLVKKYWVE